MSEDIAMQINAQLHIKSGEMFFFNQNGCDLIRFDIIKRDLLHYELICQMRVSHDNVS